MIDMIISFKLNINLHMSKAIKAVLSFAILAIISIQFSIAQTNEPGKTRFENTCARCHGSDAQGGESGPSLISLVASMSNKDLVNLVRNGRPE